VVAPPRRPPGPVLTLRCARFDELDAPTLYALLRLRIDVFVVEQACPYPELDGRDREPETRHCWVTEDEQVVTCLRILREADGTTRIGRVATAAHARGRGHARRLVAHALAGVCGPVVLDAQAYLVDFYAQFRFTPTGPEFLEDGIPHVPMRRG
jgi:ElaA protein